MCKAFKDTGFPDDLCNITSYTTIEKIFILENKDDIEKVKRYISNGTIKTKQDFDVNIKKEFKTLTYLDQEDVLKIHRENPTFSRFDISEKVGINPTTVYNWIKEEKDKIKKQNHFQM